MKKASAAEVLPKIGAAFEGGHFAGVVRIGNDRFAIIVPPKAESEHEPVAWNSKTTAVTGSMSFADGLANTQAMAKAGSAIAQWGLDRKLYIPARDELELLYRAFKPGKQTNYCWRGDNPSSDPVGFAYTPKLPAQTSVKTFRAGGTEAFEETWYWSSTQYAGDDAYAWCQYFDVGSQFSYHKRSKLRVRAVRRLKL